jgi:hypothetical protein
MSKANETDGGNKTESADEYDVPIPGLMAVDTDEGGTGVIVYRRGLTAEEQQVAATGQSIADHNPEHPPDAPTVGLLYKEGLEERWGEAWQEWPASYLAFRAGNEGMRAYDFPVTRLAWGAEYEALTEDEDAAGGEEADGLSVSCTECDFSADEGETKADYAEHFGECPECGGELREVMTDGAGVEKAEPDGTLRLTDEGIEMPDMLRGYQGQFHLRTADVTGQFDTTESGLPDTEFWDGVIAVYPDDDGDYNAHLGPGLMEIYTTSKAESTVFEVVDERTEDEEGEA